MYAGQSLLEQKRLQWAREKEEMMGLCGLWGTMDRKPEPRRNSLLPPIKQEDPRAEESETSGYISDSPQHEQNLWADRKAEKNLRNEARVSPDSVVSTPEDRLKWGDRGVGVGHLWEPVIEAPDTRLPQVFEAYRATPRWLERGLRLADGNKADILYIQHDDEEPTKFLLGQNVPLPPEVLEEREKRRQKALEHQTAIRKQLEDRERRRKEEKENRQREERLEEERILREQELERRRREDELERSRVKMNQERMKENQMREAIEAAESRAVEDKKKLKKIELGRVNEKLRDSASQVETHTMTDSSSQSDHIFDGGLALVLDGVPDAVPLALLMPQEARGLRLVSDAATQTCRKFSGRRRTSGRSDSSEKSTSLERRSTRHAHCTPSSSKHRSRSQPRLTLSERPKWGINRPTVQYLKQSEKDPHYQRRLKRRKKPKEAEKLLPSEMRLLSFQTDEDEAEKKKTVEDILENGFRMVSNPSSPRFVRISGNNDQREVDEMFESIVNEAKNDDVDEESQICVNEPEEMDSLPSTGRSDDKSNAEFADNDDSEEDCNKKETNGVEDEAINQIEALKIGLLRLKNETETRSSTPVSLVSLPEDVD